MSRLRTAFYGLAAFVAAGSFVQASLEELLSYSPPERKSSAQSSLDADELTPAPSAGYTSEEPTGLRLEDPKLPGFTDTSTAIGGSADSLRVVSAGVINEETLSEALLHALNDHYRPEGRLELQLLKRWPELKVGQSSWELEIVRFPSKGLSKRISLDFRLLVEGRELGPWNMPVQVQQWVEGYVTRRRVNAGEAFSKQQVEAREVDVLDLRYGLVPAGTPLQKFQAKQSLSANEVLVWRFLDERSLVTKGNLVEVIARSGALQVILRARALEDGALGDIVTVRNLQSNKRIQGEVIDENRVEVYL